MSSQRKYMRNSKLAVIIFSLSILIYMKINGVNGDPQVPCFFIFGHCLVDNGNNNPLITTAKFNYKPYGIDFYGADPTERFNNGRTMADVLGIGYATCTRIFPGPISLQINGVSGDPLVPCHFIYCDSLVDNGNNKPVITKAKVNHKPYGIDFPRADQTGRFNNGRTLVDILDPQVPCFFIFGDSLVDNGNNNPLITRAKVNYKPYGIDFPGADPTGRFTNGRTLADFLGQLLGFANFIAPHAATASGNVDILKGVNYASGGAGIRDETGRQLGDIIPLNEQLNNHQSTVWRVNAMLTNRTAAQKLLNKCIYYVGMGNNDYLNNYFLPQFYITSRIYTPQQYAQLLIHQYRGQIIKLYSLGARKVALFGVGQIGCIPYAISSFDKNGSACVERFNDAAQIFNGLLIGLVDELNSRYSDAKFIYINSFGMGSGDPTSAGFTVLNVGCCPVNEVGLCVPLSTPCQNRTTHIFWDSFHPTESANVLTASRSYTAYLPSDTYPIDIKRLAEVQL